MAEPRGFARLSPQERKRLSALGGKAAHAAGTAHQYTSEEAVAAGKKGGTKLSANRTHMAEIGKKGAASSAKTRKRRKR